MGGIEAGFHAPLADPARMKHGLGQQSIERKTGHGDKPVRRHGDQIERLGGGGMAEVYKGYQPPASLTAETR